ncbi:methanesulfonate monooxygenase [Variovorax sp. WS11]|uniref:2Fe-2S iron-sulfur cluster-binding protein n=1 Tax=Variovorax sp. WS11 TaxID=1105204 RepID=UPI000D0D720C|nr:2Fe-2S iron-sulfur cluster binding domain-containing protein [Variovorax sp. WS11]NDZ12735.1 2Fe-2S iron-sulfur cluster binding domain-containing protein [Variovorax sp. WS11]PSL84674.1 methanesulfonate monooxygenase [Variovorax sp. WS11]
MKITVHSRDARHEFSAEANKSLLVAGLGGGVSLPYACASGTCGTCKARVRSGSVEDLWPTAPGKKGFRDQDQILLCQCAPRSDCVLEVAETVHNAVPESVQPFVARGIIARWELLTHDVASWDILLDSPMNYEAGQFVLVSIPGLDGYRAYSIVNFERDSRRIELLIKKKPDGALSAALFGNDPVGTSVSVVGPLGQAVFAPAEQKNLLCISGGSGVAGMMSMLSRASSLSYFLGRSGHFFFGVRSTRDAFFLERLAELGRASGTALEIVICLSDEAVPGELVEHHPELSFEQGCVHEVALKRMAGRLSEVHAFLAGPPPAVDAAMRGLILQGKLSPKSISFDKFN